LTRCPFCLIERDRISLETGDAIAFPDTFPVSSGHTLVVPRRHVASLYELSPSEQSEVWNLVYEIRDRVSEGLAPDAFNIGINDGRAAGQTIMHAHVHVIPRWLGDVNDPRGGIRWVIADKAAYWRT
jgi:diadenosine tetraphosphate (Ap4A) HIT family hydrolase